MSVFLASLPLVCPDSRLSSTLLPGRAFKMMYLLLSLLYSNSSHGSQFCRCHSTNCLRASFQSVFLAAFLVRPYLLYAIPDHFLFPKHTVLFRTFVPWLMLFSSPEVWKRGEECSYHCSFLNLTCCPLL